LHHYPDPLGTGKPLASRIVKLMENKKNRHTLLKAEIMECLGAPEFASKVRLQLEKSFGLILRSYTVSQSGRLEHYSWDQTATSFVQSNSFSDKKPSISLDPTSQKIPNHQELEELKATLLEALRYNAILKAEEVPFKDRRVLTSRETEILELILEYKSNGAIAEHLNLSLRTVEKHCENIFEKLDVENRNALIYQVNTEKTA
jgi:ATP/maltotriose-dependent transcriptional regulator MalT